MRRSSRVVLSLALALFVAAPPCVEGATTAAAKAATAATLKPGDVLNQSNWQLAQGLLPPEILKHYREGEYANVIVDYPDGTFRWPPDFVEGSRRNEGRFAVGGGDQIIDKATGRTPPWILGFPFPTIDPTDPAAAVKIMWNYYYLLWYWGNLRVQSQINWVGAQRLERRTDNDANFMYYDGVPERELPPNPQNVSLQQLMVVQAPADLNGTAALTWRYRDPAKRDSLWSFVPALRRVRAVSPANRSDGFLGSDMNYDDGPFFFGKPEDFTWTLKGEVDQLRLVDPLNLQGKSQNVWLESGGWRAYWPEDLKILGYMDPDWRGVGWAPISGALAKRRFWVIEGVPRDRYYLFGRLELYVDKETYQGSWNRKFSWKGELLNTMQVLAFNPMPFTRPDGTVDYLQASNMSFHCAENIKAHQATVAGIKTSPKARMDARIQYDAEFFDMNSLARFGK